MVNAMASKAILGDCGIIKLLSCVGNFSRDETNTAFQACQDSVNLVPQKWFDLEDPLFCNPFTKNGVHEAAICFRLVESGQWPSKTGMPFLSFATSKLTQLAAQSTIKGLDSLDGKSLLNCIRIVSSSHEWGGGAKNRTCRHCGASEAVYGNSQGIPFLDGFEEIKNAVEEARSIGGKKIRPLIVVGNPPYSLDSGTCKSNTTNFSTFDRNAANVFKLDPDVAVLLGPAKTLYKQGARNGGSIAFRRKAFEGRHIHTLEIYPNAKELYGKSSNLKGGGFRFLWIREYSGPCTVKIISGGKVVTERTVQSIMDYSGDISVFIGLDSNEERLALKISSKQNRSVADFIYSAGCFAIPTNFIDYRNEQFEGSVKIVLNRGRCGYISADRISKNVNLVDEWKVAVPNVWGSGDAKTDVVRFQILHPNVCASDSYSIVHGFRNESECRSFISFMQTVPARFAVAVRKRTHHASKNVFSGVPMPDLTRPSWNDKIASQWLGLTSRDIEAMKKFLNR